MRIVSLAPATTEMLFALDLGDDVIGVTHGCDHPAAAGELPRVTRMRRTDPQPGAHGGTGFAPQAGDPVGYELDVARLHELTPDLIVTQALYQPCAITPAELRALAEEIDSQPLVIALEPHTLGEVLDGLRTIAQATGTKDAAVDLIQETSARIDRVRLAVRNAQRPRVVVLDSLDPPRVAGDWIPQLVDLAGGEDVLGFTGEPPQEVSWDVVTATQPDIAIVTPRGFSAEIAHREAEMHARQLAGLRARQVVAIDSATHLSRPGPRIIDALELMAELFHPGLRPPNPEHQGAALNVEV